MEILRARKGFSERYVVEEIAGAAANGPSYPLGLAVRDDAAEWARLLIAAQKNELHANADVPTAWLYAECMANGVLRHLPRGAKEPIAARSAWSPRDFAAASPRFREELAAHLAHTLERRIDGTDAASLALKQARELLPPRWRDQLPAPSSSDPDAAVASAAVAPCPSCGSLPGTVPDPGRRHSRSCGGDDDRLRPRADVRGEVADWLITWQPEIDPAEAARRAERLLSAMPAWAR